MMSDDTMASGAPFEGGATGASPEGESSFQFTDKRRFDPETGEAKVDPAAQPDETTSESTDPLAAAVNDALDGLSLDEQPDAVALKAENARLTEDLQRKVAEYANYRNRTQRDIAAARASGIEAVLSAMLPPLDDLERARQHGELDGPMATIADKLEAALAKFGVERFGAVGDAFDPNVHEAFMHRTDPDVETEAIEMVIEPGYRIGERVARPARVGTVGPN